MCVGPQTAAERIRAGFCYPIMLSPAEAAGLLHCIAAMVERKEMREGVAAEIRDLLNLPALARWGEL